MKVAASGTQQSPLNNAMQGLDLDKGQGSR
jgi:hypothetical protein